jgi:hypothetical protein
VAGAAHEAQVLEAGYVFSDGEFSHRNARLVVGVRR